MPHMRIDSQDDLRLQLFSRRAALMGAAQLFVFTGLFARLCYLQVVRAEEYGIQAEENRISVRLLAPARGEILDRFGRVLATNRQNFRVFAIPEEVKDFEKMIQDVSLFVRISSYKKRRLARAFKETPAFLPITIAENLTWEQFAQISIRALHLPAIQTEVAQTRDYPAQELAAHIIGYVAPVTRRQIEKEKADPLLRLPGFRVGQRGIEKMRDRMLRGHAGTLRVERNAHGRVIREIGRQPGAKGRSVQLTLDPRIQSVAAESMKKESGACVVLDMKNGDVLAMVSTPVFDPNQFNRGLDETSWRAILSNPEKPLLHRAVGGQYPPGSTFKMIVALAALEAGVIKREEEILCEGSIFFGDRTLHCWEEKGHGRVNLRKGIKRSCDVYFYEVARRTGVKGIGEMARRFGLGSLLGIESPDEKAGLVPSKRWKMGRFGERWHGGETLLMGIGQGYLLATPLQLAVMTARIANGKALLPRLVRGEGGRALPDKASPPLQVSSDDLDFIRQSMHAVSNERGGTSYHARLSSPAFQIAGKTGTSQVRRLSLADREAGLHENALRPRHERDHALFTAFAPFHNPRYAAAVVLEHGGSGSRAAAPVLRDVFRAVHKMESL